MRLGRVTKRVWAFLMAAVMVLSMVVVGNSPIVEAASQGYSVTINLYEKDKTTLSNVTEHLRSRNNEGPFYLVAVAKGGPNDSWTTYAVRKIDSLESATTTINFDKSEFRIDKYKNDDYDHESSFDGNDNKGGQGHYDTVAPPFQSPDNKYHMDSVILYRVKDGLNDADVRITNISLKSMLAQFDYSDAAPAGYKFLDNTMSHPETKSDDSATISLYKAYDTTYEIRLKADANNGVISAGDKYAVVVKVDHWLNDNPTYFVYDNLEYDGATGLVKIPVTSSDWLDRNGKPIANEQFTGNEKDRQVYLLRKKKDGLSKADLLKLQDADSSIVAKGEAVGAYYYKGLATGDEVDEDAQKEVVYDQLNLEAIPVDTSYDFLSVLGDAAGYGIVADSIYLGGHFESNFAVNQVTGGSTGFEPDLSGNGEVQIPGNFLVGSIAEEAKMNFGSSNPTSYVVTTADAANRIELNGNSASNVSIAKTSQADINDAVNGMISYMQNVSDYFINKPCVTFGGEGSNGVVIDITGFPEGAVVCVDGDKYLEAIAQNANGSTQGVNIKCRDSQLVVFNFDKDYGDTPVTLGVITVNGYDSTTTPGGWNNENNNQADYAAQHVVWNLAKVKNLNLSACAGIYLVPQAQSEITLINPPCGWIVSAGHMKLNGIEFHFVYQGLTQNTNKNLSLKKTVNDATPKNGQTFTFLPEVYDPTGTGPKEKWKAIQVHDDVQDIDVDFTVENKGSSIVIPLNLLKDGQNVIRITEKDEAGYKKNNQKFYAVFNVKVVTDEDVVIRIPGAISYYTDFDEATGKVKGTKLTSTPTFKNELAPDQGFIQITKTIKGDVTDEDLKGLKFEIFESGTDKLVETVYLRDFAKTDATSTEVKDTYTYTLSVDSKKKYYVVETLTTLAGFDVVVKNEIGTATVTAAATTDVKTGEITVANGETQNVAYENDYKAVTDVAISKRTVGGTELKGAMMTLTGTLGDGTDPVVFDATNTLVLGTDAVPGPVTANAISWTSGTTPTTVKNLPNGVYTLIENAKPNGYKEIKTNITFTVKNGVVTGATFDSTTNAVVMTDDYEAISVSLEAKKVFKDEKNADVALKGGEFTFELKDASGIVIQTKTNDATGKVAFEAIEYDAVGDVAYTISEVKGNDAVDYDETVHNVKVAVAEGAQGVGGLTATVTYDNGTKVPTFTNKKQTIITNNAEISKMSLGGNEIAGASLTLSGTLEDGTTAVVFTNANFELPGDAEGPKDFVSGTEYAWTSGTASTKIRNLPNGTYTLHEVAAPNGYETVSDIEFTLKDGKVLIGGTEQKDNKIVMVDDYSLLNIRFHANKAYKDEAGTDVAITDGEFSFGLYDGEDGLIETIPCNDAGLADFTTISYGKDAVGKTYTYKIKEVIGDETKVDFDKSEHVVKVTIAEKANGVGGLGATITVDNKAVDEVNVKFTNTKKTLSGKLIITKTFGGPVVEADFDSLIFEVKKTGATTGTEYKLSAFTPSADKKTYTLEIALSNDELGEYTVTEKNYNAESGVAVEVTHKIGAEGTFEKGTAVTTSIGDNDEKNVIFNNEYPEGNLIIKKTFGGPVVPADLDTLSFDVYSNATKQTTNYTLKTDFTKVSDTEYTMTLPVVAGGYTVTEKNYNDVSKANVKVTYKVGSDEAKDGTEAAATVVKGGNTNVEFNNLYPDKVGKLVLTKTFGGEVVEADKDTLYFEVKKDGSTATATYQLKDFTYDANSKTYTKEIELKNGELGAYTITEKNYNKESGAAVEVSYKLDGGEKTVSETAGVVVADGVTKTVAFNDEYLKDGEIIITKTFGGPVVEDDFNTLTFEVKKDGETTGTEYKLIDFTLDQATGTYSKTIKVKHADLGKYTVTEKNYNDASGVAVVVTYKVGDAAKATGTSAEVTVAEGKAETVAFNNEYPDKVGKIVITKTFGGEVVEADKRTLSFEVKKDGETTGTEYKLSDFAYDEGTKTYTKEIELKNGELGAYTITEKNYNKESGAAVEVSYKLDGGEKTVSETAGVVVADGVTKTVAFNDEYLKDGEIIITKTFGGPVVEDDFNTLTFEVKKDGETTGTEYKLIDFTLDQATGTYSKTIKVKHADLGKYTVTEKNYNDASGVAVVVTYKVGDAAEATGTTAEVTVAEGKAETVAFNNEYPDKVGKIVITKTFGGPVVEDDFETLIFEMKKDGSTATATYKLEDFTYDKTSKTYTKEIELKNGELGKYTITEKNYNKKSGAVVEVSYKLDGGEKTVKESVDVIAEDGKTHTVAFNNEYKDREGELVITKTFGGPVVEEDFENLVFEVKKDGAATGTEYAFKNFTYDKATDTYTQKIVLKNDELGSYTVTEKNYNSKSQTAVVVTYKVGDAAEATGTAAAVTVAEGKSETVAFNNEYPDKVGKIVITKTFGGPVVEADKKTLSFEVKKDGETTGTIYKLDSFDYDKDTDTYTKTIEIRNDDLGSYTVTEKNYNEASKAEVEVSYKLDGGEKTVSETAGVVVEDGKTKTVAFDNVYPTGKLTVHVTEKTSGKDVPDAEVEIKYPDGTTKTYKTDKNGEVKDENGDELIVPPGDYEVTVTKVPEGYEVTTGKTDIVNVPKNDEGHHDAVIETDRGGIIITVYDEETGDVVPNATVEVTTPDGKTKTFTTDEKGQVTEYAKKDEYGNYTAETGDYTYKVTKVPTGYHVTVGEEQTGTVETGKLTELEAKIAPQETGKITVHVTERTSGKDVPDAEVEIKYPDGTTKTYKTDENGEVKDENGDELIVPPGDYEVTVVKVPEGYDVVTGKTDIVVVPKDDEGHHEAVIATDRGGIIITVYDEETGDVVPGATIVVTEPDGSEHEYTTDENGQVTVYAKKDEYGNYTAETGDYTYKVTKVPEGYRVTVGEEQEAEVVTSELTELEAKIAPKTGGLDIKVIDEETKKPVPGATVEVQYPDGSVHEFVTDSDGMITELSKKENGRFTAKIGTYKITVTKVPEGYKVTTGKTVEEIIEVDQLKHHVAEIATATRRDTNTVQTGDSTPIALFIGLMILSAAGAAFVISRKRKNVR